MANPDELLDIVDEQCNVIGQTPKSQAHRNGNLHKCVIGEVRDLDGNWVLVRQTSDRQDAGQYVSPVGGHVQAGERDDDALRRETLEEIGLTDPEYTYVGKFIYNRQVIGRHENHYFLVYLITADPSRINLGDEAESWETFSEASLQQELASRPERFGAAFFAVLEKFYPHLLPGGYKV